MTIFPQLIHKNAYLSLLLMSLLLVSCTIREPAPRIALKTSALDDPYQNDGLSFRSLCYHDVRDNLRQTMKDWPQMAALDTYDLIQHFSWLKENGYHPVSLDQILTARRGGKKLPPKAILLTFDDGYISMYSHVFPLLKRFHYPAVIGLVGEWLEENKSGKVFYGDHWISRKHFLTWPQVREMVTSGLVEVASHSYGLHKGQIANPQGSQPPAVITHIFDKNTQRYESDSAYKTRLINDLNKNSALIAAHIGKRPRVMIWPYGAYNMVAVDAAKIAGMPITMTLEAGANTASHSLNRIRRDMLIYTDKISDLKRNLHQAAAYDGNNLPLNHSVGVDLDALYDPDPVQQDLKVGKLVERILQMRANMVYLKVWSDLDKDGKPDALYFPNHALPMRSDLANRVAWQIRTRSTLPPTDVHVYLQLPVYAFELKGLSRHKIKRIYQDAAKNAPIIAGIIFDHQAGNIDDAFAAELIKIIKIYQPQALTITKRTSTWLTGKHKATKKQLATLMQQYDFILLSIPAANNNKHSLHALTQQAQSFPQGLLHLMFELQTVNLSTTQLTNGLQQLHQYGARNFGYAPDDPLHNQPRLNQLRPLMSLKTNSGRPP